MKKKKWWQFWKKEPIPDYTVRFNGIHFEDYPDDMREGYNFHHDRGDID